MIERKVIAIGGEQPIGQDAYEMDFPVKCPESFTEAVQVFTEDGVLYLAVSGLLLTYRDEAARLLDEGMTPDQVMTHFAAGKWTPFMPDAAHMLFQHYAKLPADQRANFDAMLQEHLKAERRQKGQKS